MKTILNLTALILVVAVPALAGPNLPAQAQRIWAPTGDLIGLDDHATLSFVANDSHGDEAKLAEDWNVRGDTAWSGLFGWHGVNSDGHQLTVRGAGGTTEGSGLAGDIALWSSAPGKYSTTLYYSKHDNYYDRDSELRSPDFPYPPEPPTLDGTPHLDWRRGGLDLNWSLSSAAGISLGLVDLRREGSKSSLLRGATGEAVPQVQTMDTKQYEIRLGGDLRLGKLGTELNLAMGVADGTRAYGDQHAYDDERTNYRGNLLLAYDVGRATRISAGGMLSNLELSGNEAWGASAGTTDSELKNQAGLLAVQTRLGKRTSLNLSARFEGQTNDSSIDGATGALYATERDRSRQDYRLVVGNTSLPQTRLRLQYRYTASDLESAVEDVQAGAVQLLDEEQTRHDLGLTARTRLSKTFKAGLALRYRALDAEQTAGGDTWYGYLGDHERARLDWKLALKARLHPNIPLDVGYQGIGQTYKRTEVEVAETTWSANRLFMNINWIANSRLSVYGMVSWGQETYELDGVGDSAVGHGAYDYDGGTVRFTPGALVKLTRALELEAMWEGIRYENTGSETASLDAVKADHDRALVRARWQATETWNLAASYRRNEFDENRWDDYIQDLWTVSVSGVF